MTSLGEYKEEVLILKIGKYGHYLQHGQHTYGIKDILQNNTKTIETLTRDDVIHYLENIPFKIDKQVLRIINPSLSVRRGKYGPYIYYKTKHMKQPQFFPLKGFSDSWRISSINALEKWVLDTYINKLDDNSKII